MNAWRTFLPKVAEYAGLRNHVQQGHGNVSRLGPQLRFRTLLEEEIIEETLKHHSFRAAEKWLQEVCWRRYWKGWLEMRPQVWTHWRRRVKQLRHELAPEVLKRAEAVAAGESGVPCMDRIARELIQTGYLHNHARMWWASFWIHVECLPWELGADVFFRYLLDADPASNTLSWRWVAGLQTPGKTYLVRLSNLQKYGTVYLDASDTGNERLEDGRVTACKVREEISLERSPLTAYPTDAPPTAGPVGLWLHVDDLSPEIGPLSGIQPASIAACISDGVFRETYGLSDQRVASLHVALEEGLNRASAHYGCEAISIRTDDPAEGLCAWAEAQGLAEIVALAPMVGPVHDLLPRLRSKLELLGVRLTLVRRPSDALAFCFATTGFFPFWEKMSRHLQSIT
jgi:hypothetical protein